MIHFHFAFSLTYPEAVVLLLILARLVQRLS
jgi:hypothetical protein